MSAAASKAGLHLPLAVRENLDLEPLPRRLLSSTCGIAKWSGQFDGETTLPPQMKQRSPSHRRHPRSGSDSYLYSPRGASRAASSEKAAQPYRFAGGYQDPTGMYHVAA
ncbi:MAG: hypothetical protein ACREQ3_23885, partial [Candidatus Binatia bacterium]